MSNHWCIPESNRILYVSNSSIKNNDNTGQRNYILSKMCLSFLNKFFYSKT